MKQGRLIGQAGFTLLELLIAITIFSLILLALGGGVQFAGGAWRKQEEQIFRQGDINAVQAVLRQLLASGRDFDGGSQNLRFLGQMPAALARGGLYEIELSHSGDTLRLSWKPHFKGASTGLPQNETVFLDGVESFDLSYHLAQSGWQHALTDKSKPVDIIAIRARLSRGLIWPSLMISPAINVSSQPRS
jgi:general secretion pathway protein J